jgi:hypothetical protein
MPYNKTYFKRGIEWVSIGICTKVHICAFPENAHLLDPLTGRNLNIGITLFNNLTKNHMEL